MWKCVLLRNVNVHKLIVVNVHVICCDAVVDGGVLDAT